jgi:hypothetical protein
MLTKVFALIIVALGIFCNKYSSYKNIEVLTAEKVADSSSIHYPSYKSTYLNWQLTKEDIKTIIKLSEEIDGAEWHYFYLDLPFYYKGNAIIDGKEARYKVNAGATTVLFFADTTIMLGYKKDDFKKYFVEGRDNNQE